MQFADLSNEYTTHKMTTTAVKKRATKSRPDFRKQARVSMDAVLEKFLFVHLQTVISSDNVLMAPVEAMNMVPLTDALYGHHEPEQLGIPGGHVHLRLTDKGAGRRTTLGLPHAANLF